MRGSIRILAAAATVALLPRMAWACSVCLGDPSSGQVQGMNVAILSLMGITAAVLGGIVLFVAMLWRRAVALESEPPESGAPQSVPSTTTDPTIG